MELEEKKKTGWLSRLKQGLSKSSSKIGEGISAIFTRVKLDDETLEELEELLISSDMGIQSSHKFAQSLKTHKFDKEYSASDIKEALAAQIADSLRPYSVPVDIDSAKNPFVIMVVGVNGNGKTTTVGKMGGLLKSNGYKVMIAAGDTFRAAAVEQLEKWSERAGCDFFSAEDKADPASVAFRAYEAAKKNGNDVLLIDTAGRLQNKSGLMAELEKMVRVIKKIDVDAPHSTILVLDATTGQNAHSQVEIFKQAVNITGLVVTKLDGTAKGGVVVALADKFKLPIHAIGVGEAMEDLQQFSADDFAKTLVGANN